MFFCAKACWIVSVTCSPWGGGRCRFDMPDQVRAVFITGFREMGFVPKPFGLAFLTVASFRIIRRIHHVCSRRHVVELAPEYRVAFHIILLHLHASQNFHGRILSLCVAHV